MADSPLFRIGTRSSPLALTQTQEAEDRLKATHPSFAESGALEVVRITTAGDRVTDRTLADIGGKGLFAKEIDEALLDGRIDFAVHSMKDLETRLADGIVIGAVLEREDPRDAFISPKARSLDELPPSSVIGSASVRRQAQILHRRPDLRVVTFRGNVATRLRKLEAGDVDATLLALAGLKRLDMADAATQILGPEQVLPAVGQGAIGITCRGDDTGILEILDAINHPPSATRVTAERAMLAALDGSCRTPIGGLAEIAGNGDLTLRGLVARPDGSELIDTTQSGPSADAENLGRDVGEELRERAGPNFFE